MRRRHPGDNARCGRQGSGDQALAHIGQGGRTFRPVCRCRFDPASEIDHDMGIAGFGTFREFNAVVGLQGDGSGKSPVEQCRIIVVAAEKQHAYRLGIDRLVGRGIGPRGDLRPLRPGEVNADLSRRISFGGDSGVFNTAGSQYGQQQGEGSEISFHHHFPYFFTQRNEPARKGFIFPTMRQSKVPSILLNISPYFFVAVFMSPVWVQRNPPSPAMRSSPLPASR